MPESQPYDILLAQITAVNNRTFALAPSASVLSRTRNAIQFGLDSSRAGIITLPASCFDAVYGVLSSCREPRTQLADAFMDAGLDNVGTLSLMADLTTYGILREIGSRPVVAVAGRSRAATAVRHALSNAGILVRSPLTAESDYGFFHRMDSEIPMVVVDRHGLSAAFADVLTRRPNVIPAFAMDATAVVGPVRIGGKGACVNCFDLHQEAQDPQWRSLVNQCVKTPDREPAVEQMLTSAVTAVVMSMVGINPGSGIDSLEVAPGLMIHAHPFSLSIEHTHIDTHALCHACHRKDSEREKFASAHADLPALAS